VGRTRATYPVIAAAFGVTLLACGGDEGTTGTRSASSVALSATAAEVANRQHEQFRENLIAVHDGAQIANRQHEQFRENLIAVHDGAQIANRQHEQFRQNLIAVHDGRYRFNTSAD
jgi:hypothetical protein